MFFEYKQDIEHIEETVEQIKKSHQATITQALWVYEVPILEMQLQGIKNLPDVGYVCIRKDDKIIMETGSETADKHFLLYEFPLLHNLREKQFKIGTLQVKMSLSAVYQRLWDRIIIILFTQTLKTFLVSIFIFFLFYHIVGKHLKTMAAYAQSIRLQNLDNPLVLNRTPSKNKDMDELGLVESALNRMRLNLINEMENVRKSQEALQRSEERYKSLVSNIPGIVYRRKPLPVWEADYISDQVEEMSGYPPLVFLTGKLDFAQLIHQKNVDEVEEKISTHVKKGEAFEVYYRMQHKDGSIRWVMEKGKAVYDDAHKPLWLDGVILDISEKVETEQRLREKDLLLHSIIENTTDAVFFKDMEGRYVMANTSALNAVGQPEPNVIGKTDFDLFPKESAEIISRVDNKVMTSGKTLLAEEKIETAYGETYWQANKSPLADDRGNLIGLLGISRNISELKKIRQQNRELEKKLIQTQKLESIGTLAGGVAHDFNNILFPIIGMSELLLEDLPRNSNEYMNVQEILKAGIRGRDIVKQILAFSRKSENIRIPLHVQKVLTEVLHLVRATIPADIEIHQNIRDDCGLILADPAQIHQVAMNLVTNAFHAVEPTGGKISVQLREVVTGPGEPVYGKGPYILMSICDSGHGISPDLMEKIFEPYFSTKEQGRGSGLGLFIVYGIVQNHGGEINVYSESGKGTTFDVYLPRTDKTIRIEETDRGKEARSGNEHILLVDDDESVALLEKKILERAGYRVSCFNGSSDALEFFKENSDIFDIVISDMSMPKITGVQLAKQILSLRPDIPIIICTGFSERIDSDVSTSLGIKKFLMKPVTKKELTETVRKVLNKKIKTL